MYQSNNLFIYNSGFLWNEQITNSSLYCIVIVYMLINFFALFVV